MEGFINLTSVQIQKPLNQDSLIMSNIDQFQQIKEFIRELIEPIVRESVRNELKNLNLTSPLRKLDNEIFSVTDAAEFLQV